MMNLEKVAAAAAKECVRQHVGLDRLRWLLDAYWLHRHSPASPDLIDISRIANIIEKKNESSGYRKIPVSFPDFTHAIDATLISHAMGVLERNVPTIGSDVDVVDKWIKEFLDIHPFIDGNGRTAWILRVWLLNQWDDPESLPYFYSEEKH